MLDIIDLRTPLVGPISLSLAAGECVAVLGPSGAGKSLFLRAVVDLDPNEGVVRLGGRDRDLMPAHEWRRLVALVPSESGWWSDRVADHFAPEHDPAPLLAAVGLPDALGWSVSRLSSGERHRLAIARALALAPAAILLDEPTAALDDAATARIEDLIRARCAAGVPVLLVTHDRAQARRLAARRFAMTRGALRPEDEVEGAT